MHRGHEVTRNRAYSRAALVLSTAAALVAMTSQSALASTWTQWYYSSSARENVWHSSNMPAQAKYNAARSATYNSPYAYAWVYVPEVGYASASYMVTSSFPYQGGTFQCKWETPRFQMRGVP
jgi:hypothetical protein